MRGTIEEEEEEAEAAGMEESMRLRAEAIWEGVG